MSDDPRSALISLANSIGANPLDLATVISYESRFSPSVRGGSGNRHIGLIQFGPTEQRDYGAHQGQSFTEQLPAVGRYLTDRGFKPGMGLLDLYSTINAGRPGRYGASDAANGGMPGTVADKVRDQMGGHRKKAAAFLGGDFTPSMPATPAMAGVPAEKMGQAAAGRFGLSGAEGIAATGPVMAMPNAPQPSAEPAQSGITAADLMKLLAQPAQAAAQTPPQQQADIEFEPPPAAAPATFDAARFYSLLNGRRV